MALPDPASKPNLGDQAAKARAAAMLGTVVSGRYRIVELLAMGGVGAVYLAEHVHMHKHVAVKVLHPDPQNLPDLIPRFEREAVAGAHIQHPNVAAATDFGKLDDGSCFLVLEYVKGATLREVIRRGPMPAGRAANIARQIAAGLGAAHAMGIVHRDIKPRNVMLVLPGPAQAERDLVKIIDFGLARLELKQVSEVAASRSSVAEQRITTSGAVFGTIAYLAPEAALGMDTVDARADFYALGLVLYEMLAGKHPFDLTDPVELFRQHHKVPPPPIAERTPGVDVPPELEAVVRRLLEKAPEARYPDAASVIAALDAALDLAPASNAPLHLGDATPVFAGPSLLPPPSNSGSIAPPPASQSGSLRPPPLAIPPPPATPAETSSERSLSPQASTVPQPSTPATPPVALASSKPEPVAPPGPAKTARRWPYVAAVAAAAVGVVAIVATHSGDEPTPTRLMAVRNVAAPPPSTPATTEATTAARATAATPAPTAAAAVTVTTATASTAAPASAPFDATAARLQLRRAASARDWVRANEAFFALVEHDPDAFRDPTLAGPTRDLAAAMALAGGEGADRIFDALAHRAGSGGADVLYEIVRTRGGSKAYTRALELLSKSDVLAHATPELRVTVALRTAPCADMPALLDRAATEGDGRTLVVMQTVAASCLGKSAALAAAEKTLKKRLR